MRPHGVIYNRSVDVRVVDTYAECVGNLERLRLVVPQPFSRVHRGQRKEATATCRWVGIRHCFTHRHHPGERIEDSDLVGPACVEGDVGTPAAEPGWPTHLPFLENLVRRGWF